MLQTPQTHHPIRAGESSRSLEHRRPPRVATRSTRTVLKPVVIQWRCRVPVPPAPTHLCGPRIQDVEHFHDRCPSHPENEHTKCKLAANRWRLLKPTPLSLVILGFRAGPSPNGPTDPPGLPTPAPLLTTARNTDIPVPKTRPSESLSASETHSEIKNPSSAPGDTPAHKSRKLENKEAPLASAEIGLDLAAGEGSSTITTGNMAHIGSHKDINNEYFPGVSQELLLPSSMVPSAPVTSPKRDAAEDWHYGNHIWMNDKVCHSRIHT
ncbi:hypothetical protein GWK47_003006 [Chionoecetes opilio]|uniref:Uncharacterized protein n=1 Tax=Chionoecetes opilio TaxID=41210 RepID=A0A8J8WEW4_CHIOP|nr:hypothetical protein GWK47_003006 [Chionoecetes opilio]